MKITELELQKKSSANTNGNTPRKKSQSDVEAAHSATQLIIQAVSDKHFGLVKDLWFRFSHVAVEGGIRDHNGLTPLHIAAKNGDMDCMNFLLSKGEDINALDHDNNTPLHYAVNGRFLYAYNFQWSTIATNTQKINKVRMPGKWKPNEMKFLY